MAAQAERTGRDYLSRRKGSPNWPSKLQYPTLELREFATAMWADKARRNNVRIVRRDGRPAEPLEGQGPSMHLPVRAVEDHSTLTPDRDVARQITADFRHTHEQIMIAWALRSKPHSVFAFCEPIMTPGTTETLEDGTTEVATKDQIISLYLDGTTSFRPNAPGLNLKIREGALSPPQKRTLAEGAADRRKALATNVDAEIVENYIRLKKRNKEDATSVRKTLAEFKALVGGKPLEFVMN